MELCNRIHKIFILITIVICFIGLGIKTGLFFGNLKLYSFIYFTNQSNTFVLLMFIIYLLCKIDRDNSVYNLFYGMMLLNISITAVAYFFILVPAGFYMYGGMPSFDIVGNILLHLIIPCLVITDFLITNNRKRAFSFNYIFIWDISLILYFIFLVFIAKKGNFIPNQNTGYPYNFIAVDLFGWRIVMRNGILLLIFYDLLSFAFVAVSKNFCINKKLY